MAEHYSIASYQNSRLFNTLQWWIHAHLLYYIDDVSVSEQQLKDDT